MTNAQDVIINAVAGAGVAFVGTVLISLIRSPKLLDDERQELQAQAQSTIKEQAARIVVLESTPRRTPFEQHQYQIAEEAIRKHGETGKTVLKHLLTHHQVVFGDFHSPQTPAGLTRDSFRSALNELTGSNVVVHTPRLVSGAYEYVYAIAPGVEAAMKELLYSPNPG